MEQKNKQTEYKETKRDGEKKTIKENQLNPYNADKFYVFRWVMIYSYATIWNSLREKFIPFKAFTLYKEFHQPTNYYKLRYLAYILLYFGTHLCYLSIIWYYDAALYYYVMEIKLENFLNNY
uniref:Ribosomal protein S11 n=1 Tax=Cavenderia fasciculata TaxID=261658 RepID=B2XXA4_CACFS|nr:ribosomal protein S11 [Cavenderia fasciculata]ABX45226.1 ribosomal protein S11 [Cavenderia fasciculata]